MQVLSARKQTICSHWLVPVFFVAVVLLAAIGNTASAQIQFNPDRSGDKFAVDNMLRSGNVNEADKFEKYFTQYILPPLAKVGPPGQNKFDLPQVRQDLKRFFSRANGNAYGQLNVIVRNFMKDVIRTVRDPECRVNAILVLGDLDETGNVPGRPSKPFPEALTDLVSLLRAARLPDYMRAAAMVGVQRHASASSTFPIAPETEAEIIQLMLAQLNETKVPPTRELSGHCYLRRSAAEVLGAIGKPGKGGANVLAVKNAIDEKDAPSWFRIGLCDVIGMFNYNDPNLKMDFKDVGVSVCFIAIETAQKEFDRADKLTQSKGEWVDPDRRRLSYIFRQAFYALNGKDRRNGRTGIVGAVAGKEGAKEVQAMQTATTKIIKYLDENQFANSEKLTPMVAELKVSLPQRAEAAKLPVDVAKEGAAATPENGAGPRR